MVIYGNAGLYIYAGALIQTVRRTVQRLHVDKGADEISAGVDKVEKLDVAVRYGLCRVGRRRSTEHWHVLRYKLVMMYTGL